ncbi:MAG: hypothetical protein OEN50_10175 [Deltaproteobacteria bacterium]|nr:hypothetical protein [Deltaproteobacteria bacterium]
MNGEQVREYAEARGFHPQTIARWLALTPAASAALCRIAVALKISENHIRDLMDWLEEIALRDGCTIDKVLADKSVTDAETDPRLGRADKLKRIKEAIRRRRFPRLAQTEDALRRRIAELKLHPAILLSAPPGLEGGRLRVEFSAASQEDLKRRVAKLADAADKDATRDIFALLTGAATPESKEGI